jgi:hypothetical protein
VGSWSASRDSVVLADHLAALHRRVKRRQDIRDLMLRITRENLARRHPPPTKLAGLDVDDPSFLQAARPMSAVDS